MEHPHFLCEKVWNQIDEPMKKKNISLTNPMKLATNEESLLGMQLERKRQNPSHVNTKRRSACHQDSKQDVGKEPKKWIEVNHLRLPWKWKKLQIAKWNGWNWLIHSTHY